jgi:hypothetical protein
MDACEEIWKDGIRYIWEDSMDTISKDVFNCKIKSVDGRVVLVILPEDMALIDRFLESIPKFNEKTLRDDGVYTWILYSTAETPDTISFVATKTKSALEVGTLHKAIGRAVRAHKIHGGGELRKTGNRIEYNTLSGTYVSKWLETREKKRYCLPAELEETIQNKFKKLFPDYELILNSTTYIVNTLPLLPEDLEDYRRAGFIVEIFDDNIACKEREKAIIKQMLDERRAKRGKGRKTRRVRRRKQYKKTRK